ncbi:MAG: DMT family transporter [Truepera sp.]|nr:DMT family transporter [Truepera sp.]
MEKATPRLLPLILAVGVIAVSLAAIFIRLADAPGVVVAAYRMLLASLILLPWSIPALTRTPLTRHNALYAVLAGVLLAAHFATWITSLSYTSVAASVALVSTHPLWVALFSWLFLQAAPALAVIFGVLLTVLGAAMIGFSDLGGGGAPPIGNGLAVLGAMAAAGYLLLGRAAQQRGLSLPAYVGVAYGVAALALLPLPLLFGLPYLNYPLESFIWIALLALIPQLVGHTSFNYALRIINPTTVATVILLEPIGAGLLAVAVFGEIPTALTAVGALILVAGVILTARHNRSA